MVVEDNHQQRRALLMSHPANSDDIPHIIEKKVIKLN
jgi:hypothetical protein